MGKWTERLRKSTPPPQVTVCLPTEGASGTSVTEQAVPKAAPETQEIAPPKVEQLVMPLETAPKVHVNCPSFDPLSKAEKRSGTFVSFGSGSSKGERKSEDWLRLEERARVLKADELPAAPFELRPSVVVRDVERFLKQLVADVSKGPDGPRARTGALQEEIEALERLRDGKEMVDG